MQVKSQVDLVHSVKEAHETELMSMANVVGVGIGVRERHGQPTGELAIVVSVTHKVPACKLDPEDIVPRELDGVPVDVRAVGELTAG